MMKFARIVLVFAAIAGVAAVGAVVVVSHSTVATAGCPAANPNCGY